MSSAQCSTAHEASTIPFSSKLPAMVRAWTLTHVLSWLRSNRIDCAAAFKRAGVNGVILLGLTHRALIDRVGLREHDAWRVWRVLRPLLQTQIPSNWSMDRQEDYQLWDGGWSEGGDGSDVEEQSSDAGSGAAEPEVAIVRLADGSWVPENDGRAPWLPRGLGSSRPSSADSESEAEDGFFDAEEPEEAMLDEIRDYVGMMHGEDELHLLRTFAAQLWRMGLTPAKEPEVFRAFEAKANVEQHARALTSSIGRCE